MDPATETNNNGKRVRIAPSTASPAQSAVEKAKFAVAVALTTLPSAIKTLAYKYNAKFLELRIHLRTLDSTKSRLLQEDFIPHSARINFELNASKRVQEQAGAEYQALAEQASYALAIFKNTIKQKIARVVDLEIQVCKDEIAREFCKAVFAIAGAFAINHPHLDVANTRDLIYLVFEKHFAVLLEFTELPDAQSFFNLFKTATELNEEAHEHATLSLDRQHPVEPGEEPLRNLLEALFVQSWNAYLGVKAEQQRQLDLQEFLEVSLKTTATEVVAMELDSLTLESPELQEFVNSAIAAKTKGLQTQVSKLNNQLNAKNQNKGAKKPGAQPQKQKGKRNQTTRKPRSDAATDDRKVAAAAKGSTDAKKKSAKTRRGSQSKRKDSTRNSSKSA
jgi:hypothetical protein